MSPDFFGSDVTRSRQFTNVKHNRQLSLVFFL